MSLSLLLLLLGAYLFIQTPWGQQWIINKVTGKLSRDLQTNIRISHVDFSLFDKMHLQGVLLEDRTGDTLLYAGDLRVKITDWFFLKKDIELKYVGLEDAVIKFQRTDSVWQQQFIFDYFSSPASTDTAKKKSGLQLNLKKATFKNVTFIKKDAWLGEDMRIHLEGLSLDASNLRLTGNRYEINSLVIKEPEVALYSYPKRKPDTDKVKKTTGQSDPALAWNQAKTIFKIGDLKIINGQFSTDRKTERPPLATFDGLHIRFSAINATLSNSVITGDTVLASLQLSARERSGLEVKKLDAALKMTPQGMAFNNLDLQTNKSQIRNFFSMSYADMSELGNFIHKVKMSAVFADSYIDSDDIAFFSPALQDWKKKIELNGKVRGTVDDLAGRDLLLQAGNSTLLNGDISLTGLPDINQTFIDFKANRFHTVYADAVTIFPALGRIRQPDLKKLRELSFTGNFTGFIADFVTYGTLVTNLGTVRSDLNMKLPAGQDPVYSGSIATENFNLGEFLGEPAIGLVSLSGTIKGKGFSEKSRNTLFDGQVQSITFNGYQYRDISLKGRLDKKSFAGTVDIQDENLAAIINGTIDFNGKTPFYDLLANVESANLRNLQLTKDSVEFSGKLNVNFTSSDLDNFMGDARVSEATLSRNGTRLPFDSLIIHSGISDSLRVLKAESNEFTADIRGDFSLEDLPDAFTYFLSRYYPAYIKAPAGPLKNQDIEFDIYTYYVDEYAKWFLPGISGLDNSHLKGHLNLSRNALEFSAELPQFQAGQYQFENVVLIARGDYDSLVLTGNTSKVRINDSLRIPAASLYIRSHNDSSHVRLLAGSNQTAEKADLSALVQTYNDGVMINMNKSSFTLNGKLWTIGEDGELIFRKNNPAHGDIVLSEGDQRLVIKTLPSETGSTSDLKAELSNINLNDIAPFFLPHNRLEGLISGNILVEDPGGYLRIESDDIQTRFLRLDNDSIGELKASLRYDSHSKELKVEGSTVNQENYLGYTVDLFLGDKEAAKKNLIALKARTFPISVLERFLGYLFSDIRGYLTGDIDITGPFDNLGVTGKGRLKNASLKVNFTQCYYDIQDKDIELTRENINLDGLVLTDRVTKNPIYITGGIEHESFRNMFFDLSVSTRRPGTTIRDGENANRPVQLLNTTFKDNQTFYGNVKGTGVLQLFGSQADMVMTINANASEKDSSYVTLPPSSSRESGIADFQVERKYGREMNEKDIGGNATNIIYDVEVTANPMVTVKVVLDELTGDVLKGKGAGTLKIRSGTTEPLSLRGRFDIEQGDYLFTFQSFFKKPFEIKKGSQNYIEWNGDPYDANIRFEAVYKAENVSFSPLASSLNLSQNINNRRGDVYVVASLTDKLFKPKIDFALEFPANSVAATDPELALLLQQMQKNLNEINRQVTYLIVFNSFAPSELAGDINGANLGVSTISGMLLGVISDQLNKLFSNLLKSDKYNINFNTSFYTRNLDEASKTALNLGSNVNFSIGRSFFNNRFIISTGVGFDAPLNQAGQQNLQQNILLLPDVTMEWLINEKGTIRASFFYRENADFLTTTSNVSTTRARRAGSSISLRKDVDRFWDLFRGRGRRKQAPAVPEPANTPAAQPAKSEE